MFIPRFHQDLNKYLKPNEALIIFGPRQAGKTTLLKEFLSKTTLKYKLDSGDNIKTQQILGSQDFKHILDYAGNYELLVLDEAQKIPNIGMGLKILVDQALGIHIIATGSSSFELAGQVGEPLTGRKRTISLFPLSQSELAGIYNKHELREKLPEWLVLGTYPAVVTAKLKNDKITILEEIANSYLLKDVLELERVKGSKVLLDLLRLIAFQIGSEVSFAEIGTQLGINAKTVMRYLDILEKAFVIFNLRGFSRNLRKEITKKSKYYFYDNGVRNAVISNFNDLELRDDIGKLWENFLASERLKTQSYKSIFANNYFWRTWDQKEIDWLEEREGKLFAFEFKWKEDKKKAPEEFIKNYPNSKFQTVNRDNYFDFLV